jgi:hypothetical protein
MNKTLQRIKLRSHFVLGSGTQLPMGTKIPLVVTIEYERHDPTTLSTELLVLGDDKERGATAVSLQRPFHFELKLPSDEPGAPSVKLSGIHSISGGGAEVSISASKAQIGITGELQEEELVWIVKAELTPSGILQAAGIRTHSYTGEISVERIKTGEITVSTKLGELQVGDRYAYYDSEEYGNKVTHSVQRAAITGSIKIPKGENLASINEALTEEIIDICTILSFCYRQPVDFYEIWYVTDPNTTPRERMQEAIVRRRLRSVSNRIRNDELIHHDNLIDGGLNKLVANYKKSAHKDEITRAISFLAASYKVDFLESAYFLAYSALDLIASASNVEDSYLLATSKWKKVQKLLRAYIDSIAEKEEITSVAEQIKEKVPELRRASGDKRIIGACHILGVKIDDLWRKDGFEAGLKSATRIRNRLFHAAGGDIDDSHVNLIRIRTLIERLLLKVLEWPDERTWVWKDQELLRIRD